MRPLTFGLRTLRREFGAKKKKGGAADVKMAASTDIVNIWKDRSDPVIRPLDEYPAFVAEQLKPAWSGIDVMYQVHRGERIPGPKESWTLANSIKR